MTGRAALLVEPRGMSLSEIERLADDVAAMDAEFSRSPGTTPASRMVAAVRQLLAEVRELRALDTNNEEGLAMIDKLMKDLGDDVEEYAHLVEALSKMDAVALVMLARLVSRPSDEPVTALGSPAELCTHLASLASWAAAPRLASSATVRHEGPRIELTTSDGWTLAFDVAFRGATKSS